MKFYKKKLITREDSKAYLLRYTLFTCRFFSIKIHKIMLSDYDCHHDHPWAFISFILKGGYVEYSESHKNGSKLYGPGSILYRKAEYSHKLEIHQPCWTFVITFKKVREWGFITRKGWVPWRRYAHSSDRCD